MISGQILVLWFYVIPNLKFKSWMDSVYGLVENSLRIPTGILIEVEFQSENQTTSDFEMKKQVYLLPIVITIELKLFIQISFMYIQTIVCPPFWSTVLPRFWLKNLMLSNIFLIGHKPTSHRQINSIPIKKYLTTSNF